jgi:hypothetical protein
MILHPMQHKKKGGLKKRTDMQQGVPSILIEMSGKNDEK